MAGIGGAGFAPISQNEVDEDAPPQQEPTRATRSSFANNVQQMLRQGQIRHPIPQEPLTMPFSSPALSDTTLVSGDYLEVPIHDDPEVDLADYQEYGGYYKPKHRSLSPTKETRAGLGIEVWSVTPPGGQPQRQSGYEVDENNVEPLSGISYMGSEGFIGRDEKPKYFTPLPLKKRFSAAIFASIALLIGLGVIAMLLLPSGDQDEAFQPIQQDDGQLRTRANNGSAESAPFMNRHVSNVRRFTVEVRRPAETPAAGNPDGGELPDDGGAAPPQDTEPTQPLPQEGTTTAAQDTFTQQPPDPVLTTTAEQVPTTAAEPTGAEPTTEVAPTTTKDTFTPPPEPEPTTTDVEPAPTTTQQEIPTKPTHENPPPDPTTTEAQPTTTQEEVPTKPTHENPPPDPTTTTEAEPEPTTTQPDKPTKTTQDPLGGITLPTLLPTEPTTKEDPTTTQDTATLWPIEWPSDDPTAPGHTAPTTTKDPGGGITLPTLTVPTLLPSDPIITLDDPSPTRTKTGDPIITLDDPSPTRTKTGDPIITLDDPSPTRTKTGDPIITLDDPSPTRTKTNDKTTTHDDEPTYPSLTLPTIIPADPTLTSPTLTHTRPGDDLPPTTYPEETPPPTDTQTRTGDDLPPTTYPEETPPPADTQTRTGDDLPPTTYPEETPPPADTQTRTGDDGSPPTTYPGDNKPPPSHTTETATQEDPTPTEDPDPSPTHTDNNDPAPTRTKTDNDDPSPTKYPDETPPPTQTETHDNPSPTKHHDASPTHALPRPPAATTATTSDNGAGVGVPFTTIPITDDPPPKTTPYAKPTIPGAANYETGDGDDDDDSPIKAENGDGVVVPQTTSTWTDGQGRKHTTVISMYSARHTDTTTDSDGEATTATKAELYGYQIITEAFVHPTLTSTINGSPTTLYETIVPSTTTMVDPAGGTATDVRVTWVGYSSTTTSVHWATPTPSSSSSSEGQEGEARIADPNPAAAFAALVLPPLFALLLAVPIRLLDAYVRAYTPFHAMTPSWEGCGAAGSLCRGTGGAGGGVWGLVSKMGAGMKQGKGRGGGEAKKGLLAWVSGGLVWGAVGVVVLSGEAVRLVVVDADSGAGAEKRGEEGYLTKVGTYRPILAALLAILGVMALLSIWAFWLLRDWDTGCRGRSAWSLFRMAELGSNHDIRLLMRRLRHLGMKSRGKGGVFGWGGKGRVISNKDAAKVLTEEGGRRFVLSDWKENGTFKYGVLINNIAPAEEAMRGEKQQRSKSVRFKDTDGDNMSNHGKKGRDGKKQQQMMPFFMLTGLGRLIFLTLLLGVLISILMYDFAGGDKTAMGRSGGTKFIFMAVGILLSFMWGYFYHAVSFLSPYKLRHSPGFSREALHMTPRLHPLGGFWASTTYGWSGDPFLGFVSAAALLAEVPLPLLLANVPYTGASTSTPVTTAHLACTWAAVCVLCVHVFVVAASFLVEWPWLPIDPSTVAGAMCCAEKLVLSSASRPGGGRGGYGGRPALYRTSTQSLL